MFLLLLSIIRLMNSRAYTVILAARREGNNVSLVQLVQRVARDFERVTPPARGVTFWSHFYHFTTDTASSGLARPRDMTVTDKGTAESCHLSPSWEVLHDFIIASLTQPETKIGLCLCTMFEQSF